VVKCATAALIAVTLAISALVLPGAGRAAGSACWQQVITDWTGGQLDATYAPSCYRAAIKHLPEDLRTYSSAPDDINRALLEATSHQERSIAAAHPATRALEESVGTRTDSPPIAAMVIGALGGVVVVTGGLSGWLLARRRRSTGG